ncbi:MAG TPA: LegC family aminotransferase [Bryobacteraceae bacterium]|nr:LegC family aminotransferase [Bryobacteraceae bacterium]
MDRNNDFIPLCVPELRGREWAYVKECLDTGWVSSAGRHVDGFESAIAARVGAKYAVAAVNGTSALHTAMLVAGVEPNDEVIVSTLTFIAPANAIRYAGAFPVFVDAEPAYLQMDVNKLEHFLRRDCFRNGRGLYNRTTSRRVRAILPVHILGHPVDIDPVLCLAREFGLVVIEDASEGLGANYKERPVGSLGDIACLSFNGNKLITSGGGGMITTNRGDWAARARYLTTQAKDDPVEYVHAEIGYNYRLTNLQAALGLAQLEQLDEFVLAKRRIASRYSNELEAVGLIPCLEPPWGRSTFWMYTVMVDGARFGVDSRSALRQLQALGIQTRPLWQPIHLSPPHRDSFRTDCATAELAYRDGLSLPCSVGLTEEQQQRVIESLKRMHVAAGHAQISRVAAG